MSYCCFHSESQYAKRHYTECSYAGPVSTSHVIFFSLSSPTRSLRSSMRRVRALSASASVLSTRKSSLVTSATSTSSSSVASYQPVSKLARKNSGKGLAGPEVTGIKSSEGEARLTKSSSVPGKKSVAGINRKSKRARSGSAGRIRLESQSCPSSRPSSSFGQTSRPNSPDSPASPLSPSRRAISFNSVKHNR